MFYQPMLSLADGRIVESEALIRWAIRNEASAAGAFAAGRGDRSDRPDWRMGARTGVCPAPHLAAAVPNRAATRHERESLGASIPERHAGRGHRRHRAARRARPWHVETRDHRKRRHEGCRVCHRHVTGTEVDRLSAGHRRLRHWLLILLPETFPGDTSRSTVPLWTVWATTRKTRPLCAASWRWQTAWT